MLLVSVMWLRRQLVGGAVCTFGGNWWPAVIDQRAIVGNFRMDNNMTDQPDEQNGCLKLYGNGTNGIMSNMYSSIVSAKHAIPILLFNNAEARE